MLRYAILALACLTASCAAVKGGDEPVTMRLSPAFPADAQKQAGSIAVAPVQARGVTGAQRYAYVESGAPGEIRQAKSFFWEEPPPRILERALVAGLRGRYASVTGPELSLGADRRVVAVLNRFEEMSGAEAKAIVVFDASLIADGKLARSGHYCGSAPIGGASGSARAQAFEQAMKAAVTAFVQDSADAGAAPSTC